MCYLGFLFLLLSLFSKFRLFQFYLWFLKMGAQFDEDKAGVSAEKRSGHAQCLQLEVLCYIGYISLPVQRMNILFNFYNLFTIWIVELLRTGFKIIQLVSLNLKAVIENISRSNLKLHEQINCLIMNKHYFLIMFQSKLQSTGLLQKLTLFQIFKNIYLTILIWFMFSELTDFILHSDSDNSIQG